MAVRGHADGVAREAECGDEVGHFFGGEGGVERLGEEAALVGRGVGGVGGDEVVECGFVVWAGKVAVEQEAAGCGDADRFGENCVRFGDVMDDAVADGDVECRVGKGDAFGVGESEIDAVGSRRKERTLPSPLPTKEGNFGGGDVFAGENQHAFGGVDGGDVEVCRAAGEFDGDLRGAGAEVEDFQ